MYGNAPMTREDRAPGLGRKRFLQNQLDGARQRTRRYSRMNPGGKAKKSRAFSIE